MSVPLGQQPDATERSSEELAADAAAGSSACFEVLVGRLGPRLLRYLRRRVGDLHAAEDLLQETFLKAYRNLGRFDPSRSFRAWLFTIATNLTVSYWRSRKPAVAMEGIDPPDTRRADPAATASIHEQHEGLWALAARVLPDGQLTALWLRYAEEMAISEVAASMNKTPGAVKVLLHRAHRRLMQRTAVESRPAGGRARHGGAGECIVETS